MSPIDIFVWNESFNTGLREVDEQHLRLVQLINRVAGKLALDPGLNGENVLGALLEEFRAYAQGHFRFEEALWGRYMGGQLSEARHRQEHRVFEDRLAELMQEAREQPSQEVLEHMLDYLVRWLAGMHVDADPQHRLDAQLRLSGYIADGSEQGQTYQIEYFRPVATQRNRVELAGGPVVTEGGLELADAVVYCFRPAGAPEEQLAVDLTWRAPGPQPVDASVSMRLVRIETDGGGAPQVDAWLQNANGRGAPAWDSPDGGTQFFEFPNDPIAAGAYEVWAIPYATASMQALPVVGEPPSYSLGRVDLPLCGGQP